MALTAVVSRASLPPGGSMTMLAVAVYLFGSSRLTPSASSTAAGRMLIAITSQRRAQIIDVFEGVK